MTDTWERRSIPNVAGWNNAGPSTPPPAAILGVSYDSQLDRLIVSSNSPFFGGADFIFADIVGSATNAAVALTYVDDYTAYYQGASAGLNAPTDITQVTIGRGQSYASRVTTGVWNGSVAVGVPLTYPTLQSICSPAPDTVRLVGSNFLNATAGPVGYTVIRLADYSAGNAGTGALNGPAMQHEFADGSPDTYDWTLVTLTDTVIELSNPRFSSVEPSAGPGDFVVTGVAFHDPTATTMYYYEPWGETFSTGVDGAGCP